MYHLKDFCGVCLSDEESLAVPQSAVDSYSELRRLFPETGLDTQVCGWLCAQCRGSVAALCVFRDRWLTSQRLLRDFIAQHSPEPAPTAAVHITLANLRGRIVGSNITTTKCEREIVENVWIKEEPESDNEEYISSKNQIQDDLKNESSNYIEDIVKEENVLTIKTEYDETEKNYENYSDNKDIKIEPGVSAICQEDSKINVKSTSNHSTKLENPQPTTDSDHMRMHSVERPYQCEMCHKSYDQPSKLTRHRRKHTGVRYKCKVCEETFKEKGLLEEHLLTHTDERPYKCNECDKDFKHHQSLFRHKRLHSGGKRYECSVCSKSFGANSYLNLHLRSHTGEKPFQCTICNKSFSQKSNLTEHSRLHSGNRPYQCNFCEKSFGHRSNLVGHMRSHTGERPYQCDLCDKSFKQKKNLNGHVKLHSSEELYKCNECGKTFNRRFCLIRHAATHTNYSKND